LALIAECFAFAAAIVIRLSGIRKERDRALRAELVSAQDKLKLATDLRKSQDDYIHARKMADIRRNQLSAVSHDLQQPLISLRAALGKIASHQHGRQHGVDAEASEQMYAAFDYLENLARDQISTHSRESISTQTDGTKPETWVTFPVRTILDNVYAMFKDEANDEGLDFRYRSTSASMDANIISDPLPLMRAVNNLVSNAIKNTDTGSILLAARRRKHNDGDCIRIEIWDTGVGMSKDDIDHLSKRHNKSEHSDGCGLGLAIVKEISDTLDLDFKLNSRAGKGTAAFLYMPSA
jgi:signal transduction histidine kinase